jgi:hypothetical protein
MTATLLVALQLRTEGPLLGRPIWVRVTMTNGSEQELTIVTPEVGTPPPDLGWTASAEAYRIALLMSLGIVTMAVWDAEGRPIESRGLIPWVTPVLGQLTLQPGRTVELDFDLNELFAIHSAGRYSLEFRYRVAGGDVEASTDIEIRPGRS